MFLTASHAHWLWNGERCSEQRPVGGSEINLVLFSSDKMTAFSDGKKFLPFVCWLLIFVFEVSAMEMTVSLLDLSFTWLT